MLGTTVPGDLAFTFPPGGIGGPVTLVAMHHTPLAISHEVALGHVSCAWAFRAKELKTARLFIIMRAITTNHILPLF